MARAGIPEKRTSPHDAPRAHELRARLPHADPSVYAAADADFEAFWAARARAVDWSTPFSATLEWRPPHARWFVGGRLNACENAVDRHLASDPDRKALVWEGEPGDTRSWTYAALAREVGQAAGALLALGVRKGDRVTTYLPVVPELAITMLACARIGAIHNVVFAGFGRDALAERLRDSGSRTLVTCDGYYRRGATVAQKARADEALARLPARAVDHVLVVRRAGDAALPTVPWDAGRDRWWHEELVVADDDVPCEPMESTDPLFVMYTSGTTGKPKGTVHATGGYVVGVHATAGWVLGLEPNDAIWCMADLGWITGHSYAVYGPLLHGAMTILFEGAPDFPDASRPWRILEHHRATVFYTSPTAIRSFVRQNVRPASEHDLSLLRLLGSVGETLDAKAWEWYAEEVGAGRVPVVDTWWQTETGMIVLSPLPGLAAAGPGSVGRPFPGLRASIVDDDGNPVAAGERGNLVLTRPWPAMLLTLWDDDERYRRAYWGRWGPEVFDTGDLAFVDSDGNYRIAGRSDDVLKVAGHRLGSAELERALVAHPDVAEAAVVGAPDALKGEVPVAFVVLREGAPGGSRLVEDLRMRVRLDVGPIGTPQRIVIVPDLPQTRSGKILRRLVRGVVRGHPGGDASTLRNPESVAEVAARYRAD